MMKKLSSKFITNTLIVILGITILFIAGLVSYSTFIINADEIQSGNDNYQLVQSPPSLILQITNDSFIKKMLDRYHHPDDEYHQDVADAFSHCYPNRCETTVFPVPDYSKKDAGKSVSMTEAILEYGRNQAIHEIDSDDAVYIRNALLKLKVDEIYFGTNYRIKNNILYVQSRKTIYESVKSSLQSGDLDVWVGSNSFLDPINEKWAFYTSVNPGEQYRDPKSNSLAINLMRDALQSAKNADKAQDRIIIEYEAESDSNVKEYAPHIDMIQAAIDRYSAQIPSSETSSALSISFDDSIEFGAQTTISFSVNAEELGIDRQGAITAIKLEINGSTVCSITSPNSNDGGNCRWNGSGTNKTGTFPYGPTFTTIENWDQLGSKTSGEKTIRLVVLRGEAVVKELNKTIYVQPDFDSDSEESNCTDGNCSGSSGVQLTVKTPNAVSKASGEKVKVTISGDGLNNVEHLKWYVCNGKTQGEISSSDSNGCDPKGDEIATDGENSKTRDVDWDISGTPVGTSVVMVKAYGPKENESDQTFPYIEGSKVVSKNITVTDEEATRGTSGGGGGGSSDPPDEFSGFGELIANIQHSTIQSIETLIKRVGSFTMMILGFLAVVGILIAGMKYITSGGDEKKAEVGKKAILFTVYGIIIAVTCITLLNMTIQEVGSIMGGSTPKGNDLNTILEQVDTEDPNSTAWGGPNANLAEIIGQQDGMVWRFIRLAVLYAEGVALFFILYASFLYMTSYGDESKAESAKKTIIWALIGLAVVVSASTILNIFGRALV